MIKIRLRHWERDVNFQRCDATQWEDHAKMFAEKITQRGDAIGLLSSNRKLIRFILGASDLQNDSHVLGTRRAYVSIIVRLDKGSWSEDMLHAFCLERGIEIINMPSMAQALRHPWSGFGEKRAAA